MSKINYIKCPRCELNYIDSRQDICDVCKEELGQPINVFIDEEFEVRELCPICKTNYLNLDEELCEACAAERAESAVAPLGVEDDSWREFLDDEPEEVDNDEVAIPLEDLKDEEFNSDFDDEEEDSPNIEEYKDELDDFDFDEDSLGDYDEDEDEEDDEDEE